ncbi:unconventional prefoldin RPB5 interactor 1 isoform X1 [Salmo trutta]|uniref:Protein phosphatase 1 regulatory subunit 19 n=1 Tax=Salmo trutta TaxID=8032 RepID=A0A673XXH7_SALTR|nr:unconventional prefoldin RPB5 interactor 1-like isoform X1 [Salmo trutta]
MAERNKMNIEVPQGVDRLRVEHKKVVQGCEGQIQHWAKVKGDYETLEDRLKTLPDQVSYDIMVPFGPLAFMPGKLVHTNEITVLLGDNWFAKCSAKQAQKLVEHRKKHVNSALDDLHKTRKDFEARVGFTEDLEKLSGAKGDYVDIREEVGSIEEMVSKGKQRVALKPHSKPKMEAVVKIEEEEEEEDEEGSGEGDGGSRRRVLSEEELWARLDELEAQEEQEEEHHRRFDSADTNGNDDTTSSEEEKEGDSGSYHRVNGHDERSKGREFVPNNGSQLNSAAQSTRDGEEEEDEAEEEEGDCLPTIYFSHTVEPKKVRINTGKNTMLKFSELKEQKQQAKRKKKNGTSNGHSHHGLHNITTPTDLYRLFVDVKNGEPIPRKSILKSRSRESSVCSDTSESSAADFEERRTFGRTLSHDENTYSDTSDGITEEDSPTGVLLHPTSSFQAFSGTVVEKEPIPLSIPQFTIALPALPTIPERKLEEVAPEAPQEAPKRVSKFKAARLQQK